MGEEVVRVGTDRSTQHSYCCHVAIDTCHALVSLQARVSIRMEPLNVPFLVLSLQKIRHMKAIGIGSTDPHRQMYVDQLVVRTKQLGPILLVLKNHPRQVPVRNEH